MPDKADIESIARNGAAPSRRLWPALPLALLVAGGVIWWQAAGSDANAVRYTAVAAKRTDIIVTVTATGTIEPINQVPKAAT